MTDYSVVVTKKTFTKTFDAVRVVFTSFTTFKKIMFWWRGVWKSKV